MTGKELKVVATTNTPLNHLTEQQRTETCSPDVRALTVAGMLQDRVYPHRVYLFGSRARGDWSNHSDIDLMVLSPERMPQGTKYTLESTLRPEIRRLFGHRVELQVFNLSLDEFEWGRASPNHLAGGVQRDGINPEGEPMPRIRQNNPWPAVQQHLVVTRQSLYEALVIEGIGQDGVALRSAHNALANVLKSYLSACSVRYDRTHDLVDLAKQCQDQNPALTFPDMDWLEAMTNFRQTSPYVAHVALPFSSREAVSTAQRICGHVTSEALLRCQKSPADMRYEPLGFESEDLQLPLGGVEHAEPGTFHMETQLKAAQAETQRQALLDMAQLICSTDQYAAFEQELNNTPWENWPSVIDVYGRFSSAPADGGN